MRESDSGRIGRQRIPTGGWLLHLLIVALLALIFLLPVTLGGRVLLPATFLAHFLPWSAHSPPLEREPGWNPLLWDALAQFYPWRWFMSENLRAGRLPLWNPYQFGGMPFLANGQSAVYYPLSSLAFLVLPFESAFGWLGWIHLSLAGFFTWGLLCALGVRRDAAGVGAVAFAFCGFMVTWLELPTLVQTATWLPALLWGIERAAQGRRSGVLGGGLALGMAGLAGHLQILVYVALAGLTYTGFRLLVPPGEQRAEMGGGKAFPRRPAPLLAIWLMGGLIAAAQGLPSLELVRWSHRQAQPTEEGYQGYLDRALSPLYLVTFFMPGFFGDPSRGDYWGVGNPRRPLRSPGDFTEFNGYLGLLPLWLAAWGWSSRRRREGRFFAGLATVALGLAFGAEPNRWLYFHLPGFSGAGGPCRMVLLYLFGMSVLAALGAERWLEQGGIGSRTPAGPAPRAGVAGRWWGGGAILLGLTLFAWLYAWNGLVGLPQVPSTWAARTSMQSRSLAHWALCFVAAGGWLRGSVHWPCTARIAGLMALVFLDLLSFGVGFNPAARPPTFYQQVDAGALAPADPHARVIVRPPRWALHTFPRALLPPNTGMVYRLRQVQGYDSLYLTSFKQWLNAIEGREASPLENGNMVFAGRADPRWWQVLGVERLLSDHPMSAWQAAGWREEQQGVLYVYHSPVPVQRARLYPPGRANCRVKEWGAPRQALAAIAERGGDPRTVLIVEQEDMQVAQEASRPADPQGRPEAIAWVRDEPNRVELQLVSHGSWLLLADVYAPGWQAWRDDRQVPVYRAQGLLRAVQSGHGESRVRFVYRPLSVRLGQFCLGLGVLLAVGWRCARRD